MLYEQPITVPSTRATDNTFCVTELSETHTTTLSSHAASASSELKGIIWNFSAFKCLKTTGADEGFQSSDVWIWSFQRNKLSRKPLWIFSLTVKSSRMTDSRNCNWEKLTAVTSVMVKITTPMTPWFNVKSVFCFTVLIERLLATENDI